MDIQKRKTELERLHKKKQRNLARRKARHEKRHIDKSSRIFSHKITLNDMTPYSFFPPTIMNHQDQLFWQALQQTEEQNKLHKYSSGFKPISLVTPQLTYASALVREVCTQHKLNTPQKIFCIDSEYDITKNICSLFEEEYDIVSADELQRVM